MKALLKWLTGGLTALTAGIWMNYAAMIANGWRMPELAPGDYPGYVDALSARAGILGDWIAVGRWLMSPGDLLIYGGGVVVFVVAAVLLVAGAYYGVLGWQVRGE